MATEKEQTLQIKDFRGVSRYLASPNNPPNKFVTVQNMYSPNRGELAYIDGVSSTNLAADGFTGLCGDFNFNGQRLLLNSDSGAGIPVPGASGETITFGGTGGATTAYFRVTYAGLGYETPINAFAGVPITTLGAGGVGGTVSISFSSNIPNGVCQINFFIADTDTDNRYVLVGSFTRSNKGSFPLGTQHFQAGLPVYDSQPDPLGLQGSLNAYDPIESISIVPQNNVNGTLVPGQTYFFAFVPMVSCAQGAQSGLSQPIASMYVDLSTTVPPTAFPSEPIAVTMPTGKNSVSITITSPGKYDGVHTYNYSYIFIGTSPEEMMMAAPATTISFGQGYTGQTTTYGGPCPIPISGFNAIHTAVVILSLSPCSNLGIAMLPYAQAILASATPTYTWESQRIGVFWLGGLTYSNTGNYVCGLLFPKNQLTYDNGGSGFPGVGINQVLPVRGAGTATAFGPGLAAQFAPTGIGPFTINTPATAGSTTNGSNKVILDPAVGLGNVRVGQLVTGTGIPAGSHIINIDPTQNFIYLSHNATVTSAGVVTLTFSSGGSAGQSSGQMLADGTVWDYNATSATSGAAVAYMGSDLFGTLFPYVNSQFYITTNGNGTNKIRGTVLGKYAYFVNGFQQPFYTNGQIFKPLMTDAMSAYAPICSSIIAFKRTLVMGGGPTNNYANEGQIYWSSLFSDGTQNPFSFSPTETWGSLQNSATLLGNGPGNILGFGIFAYNESVNAITSQLVIGTDSSVWMTSDPGTQNPQEVGKGMGFASPDCFVNTNIGAIYVGRDNLYQLNQFGMPVAKGQDVLPIIRGMQKSGTNYPPIAYYHKQQVKIAYSTGGTSYDTEIWCDVQLEKSEQMQGENPRWVFMGPHTLNNVQGYAVFPSGIYTDISPSIEDYRTGFTSTTASVLDYPGRTSNNFTDVARKLVFNDLYLNSDDFMKCLTRLYIGGKFTSTPTVTITFNMTDQDGAGMGPSGTPTAFSDSIVLNPNAKSSAYMLNEKLFATRYRGRIVNALTLSWVDGASEQTINIYELGILYESERRRRL